MKGHGVVEEGGTDGADEVLRQALLVAPARRGVVCGVEWRVRV